jgi:hypothetical protein
MTVVGLVPGGLRAALNEGPANYIRVWNMLGAPHGRRVKPERVIEGTDTLLKGEARRSCKIWNQTRPASAGHLSDHRYWHSGEASLHFTLSLNLPPILPTSPNAVDARDTRLIADV